MLRIRLLHSLSFRKYVWDIILKKLGLCSHGEQVSKFSLLLVKSIVNARYYTIELRLWWNLFQFLCLITLLSLQLSLLFCSPAESISCCSRILYWNCLNSVLVRRAFKHRVTSRRNRTECFIIWTNMLKCMIAHSYKGKQGLACQFVRTCSNVIMNALVELISSWEQTTVSSFNFHQDFWNACDRLHYESAKTTVWIVRCVKKQAGM